MAQAKKSVTTPKSKVSTKISKPKATKKPVEAKKVVTTQDGHVLTAEEEALLAQAKADQKKSIEEKVEEVSSDKVQEEAPKVEESVEESSSEPIETSEPKDTEDDSTSKMIKNKAKEAGSQIAAKMKVQAVEKAKELGKKGFKNVLAMAKDKALPKSKSMAKKALKTITLKKLLVMLKK